MFPSGLLFVYLVATLGSLIALYVWKHRRYYYLGYQLPGSTLLNIGRLFYLGIFGSMEALPQNLLTYYEDERTKHPSLTKLWYGWRLGIIILDPELVQKIYQSHLLKDTAFYILSDSFINGRSIFQDNDLRRWKIHRKLITRTSFNMAVLKSLVKIFHKETLILTDKLAPLALDGQPFEPMNRIGLAGFSMIVRSMTSLDLQIQRNFCDNHPFIRAFDDAFDIHMIRVLNPWLLMPTIFNLSRYKKQLMDASTQSRAFAEKVVAEIKSKVMQENTKREESFGRFQSNSEDVHEDNIQHSLAEVIIRDQLNPNIPTEDVMPPEELISEIITMLFAGMDTTKVTNAIILVMLALHPKVQQEVYDEIQSVMGNDPTLAPTYEQLSTFHALTRVIKETMRLFPAAPMIGREAEQEFQVDGYTIPKGAAMWIGILGLHRDHRYWPNPNRFDPDRFLPSETSSRRIPNAYMPFSTGARNCIGLRYAMLQMKTMISTIVRRYRILPGDKCKRVEDVRFTVHLTLKLLEGNDIRLEPRTTDM
uniref:Cytochrome P450 4C1 n=3 Tax=Cacopsylla melanoneura TaxID=428564 RepID=A0A8D8UVE3_9HEMI